MGRRTAASIVDRRALNQAIIHAARLPVLPAPELFVRALRSALRMSQAQLARRSGIPQANIARLEAGKTDVRLGTLRRLFAALFCDLAVFPRPRQRPGDVLADRYLERPHSNRIWD